MNALVLMALAALAAAEPAQPKLLVLEFKSSPDATALAHALTQEAAAALGDRGYDVVAFTELKDALALQGEKQSAGCDDAGCAADVAGALGAELVLFGDVTKVDSLMIVSVQLYDAKRAQLVAREVVRGNSVDDVVSATRAAVRRVVPARELSPLFIAGGVVSGVGVVAALMCGAGELFAQSTLADRAAPRSAKDAALVEIPVCGVVIASGAALGALGAGAMIAVALTE